MKTRDAFAIKNFVEHRIIASLAVDIEGDDEQILYRYQAAVQSKSFAEDDERAADVKRHLADLMTAANQYQTRLTRHNDRLMRYTVFLIENFDVDVVIQSKVKRAKKLSARYADACRALQDLQRTLYDLILKVDEQREARPRAIFSTRLRAARKAVGLTQQQVADKLEMTASGYNQYELARRDPSIPTLIKIARILNRSADWLLGLTP